MDVYRTELPGTALLQKTTVATEETLRPPLLSSEVNNAAPIIRKPRTREITSRYMCAITPTIPSLSTPAAPRRCPSPTVGRVVPAPVLSKRAQSAERRRPSSPCRSLVPSSPSSRPSTPSSPSSRPSTPTRELAAELQITSRRLIGGRTPDGLWPSMRSLSSSFQSESISIPTTRKDKAVSNANVTTDHTLKASANMMTQRKRTPLRGRNASDQSENSRPVENSHVRVVDQHPWPRIMGGKLSASTMTRSMDLTDRVSKMATLPTSSQRVSSSRRAHVSETPSRGIQKIVSEVSRRLSLDGNGRLELENGTSHNVFSNHLERAPSLTCSSRTQSSPIRGQLHPSSPSKACSASTASPRGITSPSRTRPSSLSATSGVMTARVGISSSVLNYIDVRKGKKSGKQIENAHQLQLLYNRDVQWRFVNARADAALSIQEVTAKKILYSAWAITSELHDSVIMKRINMQQFRQDMKLNLILKDQMRYLEDWAFLEREHSCYLSGAIEALKTRIVQLPVTEGARVDVNAFKDAVSSAVDIMQVMGSSICCLLSRLEGTNCLVSEIADVAEKERAMLDECRKLLASTAALQAQESSLRTHILQLRQDMVRPKKPILRIRI